MSKHGRPAACEIENLVVKRGDNLVFDGLKLEIASGEITGLMGPSGCGKTTLMRSIVGVQKIKSGAVTVLGLPAGSKALRRKVAHGTQGSAVYGDLTVRQNLQYFAAILGAPKSKVDSVIEQVGLGNQANQLAERLSGGQLSRTSLGVGLLGEPELLVLDEPTVGLDPVVRQDLWNLFQQLSDNGTTMLVSSHVMDEASHCDRILLMREGRIIANTTASDLLSQTHTTNPDQAFLALIEKDKNDQVESETGQ